LAWRILCCTYLQAYVRRYEPRDMSHVVSPRLVKCWYPWLLLLLLLAADTATMSTHSSSSVGSAGRMLRSSSISQLHPTAMVVCYATLP
jgi:hypothetical protein